VTLKGEPDLAEPRIAGARERADDRYMEPAPLVLVADDEADILELVRLRLVRSGYEVAVARDGHEALQIARERTPAIALVDVTMPGLDGYEVARALRTDPATSGVQLILLTGRTAPADVARGFEAGVDDYITKPFSPQALQLRVAEALRRARPASPLLRAAGS
jgi:two-component system, OmpR family, phosphate regulon response regulator PhoB